MANDKNIDLKIVFLNVKMQDRQAESDIHSLTYSYYNIYIFSHVASYLYTALTQLTGHSH
jgi:hypothetical protein